MVSDKMLRDLSDIRNAQKEENDLLNDCTTIFEQMKLLNATRGSSMEALAAAHSAEVQKLKIAHAVELEAVRKKHEAEMAKMKGSQSNEARPRGPNTGLGTLLRQEIVEINVVLAGDQEQKERMYGEIQNLSSRKKELLQELDFWMHRQKTLLLDLLEYGSGGDDLQISLRTEQIWEYIEFCTEAQDRAKKYAVESELHANEVEKAWHTLEFVNKATHRERIDKLLEVAAAGGIQIGLTTDGLLKHGTKKPA